MARFVGYLLVLLGGLWSLLAGGCTLIFLGVGASEAFKGHADPAGVFTPLVLGGIGIAPGLVTLWAGIAILRGSRRKAP